MDHKDDIPFLRLPEISTESSQIAAALVALCLVKAKKTDNSLFTNFSVPHMRKATYHHAEYLAREMGQDETNMFKDEYIFEWEVPEKYIVHKVSVQTLLASKARYSQAYSRSY